MAQSKSKMKGTRKLADIFCMSKFKVFLLALFFAYMSKTMSGAYVNSMLTQIERRFNIPTSLVGVISGSFEMGNLLLIAFVSYLGAKCHRPRLIGVGCAVMALGCFLMGLPHFLMGRYQYEAAASLSENFSSTMTVCLANHTMPTEQPSEECDKQSGSLMWVFVFVGNIIRGIGETPVTPLGISYVEDFAKPENSPFYIGCLQIATILGPLFGLMLGSYCAQLYVDVGSVDPAEVTLSLLDARWVGAWWLGILLCTGVNLLVTVPFFFLPRTLPKEGEEDNIELRDRTLLQTESVSQTNQTIREIAKDFIPYLKSLFYNPIYMLFICITVVQFNAFVGEVTFMPKYLEQQFGTSASNAIFLMAVYNLPIICTGYLLGGFVMKKFKISTYKAAHIGFWSSVIEYLIYFITFFLICKNASVAGLTVSYEGIDHISYSETSLLADCNRHCECSTDVWDPVCGENGITYISACLAGCEGINGTGRNTVFENCACIPAPGLPLGNSSAVLGQCNREAACGPMLHYFLVISFICCFIYSAGAMPGYMVLIRSLKPEEKSFGVGLHAMAERVLAGIPSPIYFGAMIDTTCLKWGTKSCGGEGACRMYDSDAYSCYGFHNAIIKRITFGNLSISSHLWNEEKEQESTSKTKKTDRRFSIGTTWFKTSTLNLANFTIARQH
ncbi:solute carrier organic anion transporter family member 1A2-like [Sphaerodactylus townsendi]|uniref:solute carrier organic anion transporter family member 1A2-like n=1 Tax=Sphaerodactylus townsendi TaxID=933632 RepID=UPI0020274F4B|nr:solute carrier organic anion transporter family member 1A2-like [Sphaerodactylus townsendi]